MQLIACWLPPIVAVPHNGWCQPALLGNSYQARRFAQHCGAPECCAKSFLCCTHSHHAVHVSDYMRTWDLCYRTLALARWHQQITTLAAAAAASAARWHQQNNAGCGCCRL
jgi:hypothetical protein